MVIKIVETTFSSDLRKPCWITGKSLSPLSKKSPVLEKSQKYIIPNRMRSLHSHKSSYSCESAIYFNLTTDIIRNNCNFDLYFNKTDVTHAVLDGGDEIILANWPNDKHIICNINNVIPVKIPSHPYVLVNSSSLCNCGIEVDNHHLLESLATCDKKLIKLAMHFTINLAFADYMELMPNITDQLTLNRGKTNHEQPLPVYLNISCYDNSLSDRSGKLKEFIHNYI